MRLIEYNNRSSIRLYRDGSAPVSPLKTVGMAQAPWRSFLNHNDVVKERHTHGKHPVDRPAIYTREAHDEWVRSRFVQTDTFDPVERGRIR